MVVWIPGIPENERDCYLGAPLKSQTTGPQTTNFPLVDSIPIQKQIKVISCNICKLYTNLHEPNMLAGEQRTTRRTRAAISEYLRRSSKIPTQQKNNRPLEGITKPYHTPYKLWYLLYSLKSPGQVQWDHLPKVSLI